MAVLGAALATTGVGLLGGLGVPPFAADAEIVASASAQVALDPVGQAPEPTPTAESTPAVTPTATPEPAPTLAPEPEPEPAVPAGSGQGRRVVFSETAQRVWLIEEDGEVARTYLASGSLTDNLQPGTYTVFSRSEDAYGIGDSGTMSWFVRFTRGPTGAAIGFHDIPVHNGAKVQTKAQLGTEQSHGCIRQRTKDAKRLWDFAPLGATVVVV